MKEGSRQSKLKHYILAPVRILKRARQLYLKGVVDCAGGYGDGAISPVVHHISHLPNTDSLNHSSRRTSGGEGRRELLRTVQVKSVGNENKQRHPFVGYECNRMKMSYSAEVRKMGRIDKDQPCSFEEDQMDFKNHESIICIQERPMLSTCVLCIINKD